MYSLANKITIVETKVLISNSHSSLAVAGSKDSQMGSKSLEKAIESLKGRFNFQIVNIQTV